MNNKILTIIIIDILTLTKKCLTYSSNIKKLTDPTYEPKFNEIILYRV